MTDLGTLDPLHFSFAVWINSKEQVVGWAASKDYTIQAAWLWENGGPMVNLNALVYPDRRLLLEAAFNINDRGEISGEGVDSNDTAHAFLLIPCDENHPGIEGCDYSPVDEHAAPTVPPVLREPVMASPYHRVWERNNRTGSGVDRH
jgi:probable HAF family extracellular repeat protein